MNVGVRVAAAVLLAVPLAACGESPSLIGTYTSELSDKTLQDAFPGTSAPPGAWKLEFTEFEKVVVDAPGGGGFSLTIKSLEDDEVTFEATGCPAADGSKAGDPVYAIEREDDALVFTKVRDECVEKDPEAALLTVGTWKRDSGPDTGQGSGY
jgi:hypothetical protein